MEKKTWFQSVSWNIREGKRKLESVEILKQFVRTQPVLEHSLLNHNRIIVEKNRIENSCRQD